MGMFDEIHYQGEVYQTKDTPCQTLDKYKIEHDQDSGHIYLWHEAYKAKMVKDKDNKLFGYRLETWDHRWEHCHDFDGAIRFYREDKENGGYKADRWIEYKALFMNGQLLKIEKIDE